MKNLKPIGTFSIISFTISVLNYSGTITITKYMYIKYKLKIIIELNIFLIYFVDKIEENLLKYSVF